MRAARDRVRRHTVPSRMEWKHASDHDLERYDLGMINTEEELAPLEEHILACPQCAKRAQQTQDYVGRDPVRDYRRMGSSAWLVAHFKPKAQKTDEQKEYNALKSTARTSGWSRTNYLCRRHLHGHSRDGPLLSFAVCSKPV